MTYVTEKDVADIAGRRRKAFKTLTYFSLGFIPPHLHSDSDTTYLTITGSLIYLPKKHSYFLLTFSSAICQNKQ